MGKTKWQTLDIYRGFRPTPSQTKFLTSNAFGRLFSSGYGSGKSITGCREGLAWALDYAGSKGLIARKTATDLRDTTMVTFWKSFHQVGLRLGGEEQVAAGTREAHYNRADKTLTFWNGSDIKFRHLDDPNALGSLELNWAFIDEGSEVSDDIYKTITSSRLRWHLPVCDHAEQVNRAIEEGWTEEQIAEIPCNCPRGIWVCTNPGASGYLRAVTRGEVADWEWIKAKPGDNPYNGPDYYAKMERDAKINGEIWMRKFKEGDWDAFEGQRFTMFDRNKHVLASEFRPTPDHSIVLGWDFGHIETFISFIAYKRDGSEPCVVFDEVVVNELLEAKEAARPVLKKLKSYGLDPLKITQMGDPAGDAAGQFSAVSAIGAYAALGLYIAPCRQGKDPVERANLLTRFLNEEKRMPDGSWWPGIVFGPNVERTIDSIVQLRWKPVENKLGEDPTEKFVNVNKHGFDALTYGIYAVPAPRTEGINHVKPRWMSRVNPSAADVVSEFLNG